MQHFEPSELRRLGREGALEAMRSYLCATAEDQTAAPPRMNVPVRNRQLVFTVGASATQDVAGFRLYSIDRESGTHDDSQLLVLLRLSDGQILATARGPEFGAWRTAALGGVAMEVATRALTHPIRVAVLGAGFQAFHHARTWASARSIESFQIWARRREAAESFAMELAKDTNVPAHAEVTSGTAAEDADAVLAVTRSSEPVVAAEALASSRYVATVGPKFGGRNELPGGVYSKADVLVSDAPEQCASFESKIGPLPGGRTAAEMTALSDIVAGVKSLPGTGQILFVSEGLAGSEVALLGALFERDSQLRYFPST